MSCRRSSPGETSSTALLRPLFARTRRPEASTVPRAEPGHAGDVEVLDGHDSPPGRKALRQAVQHAGAAGSLQVEQPGDTAPGPLTST